MAKKLFLGTGLVVLVVVGFLKIQNASAITVNCQTQSDLESLEGAARAYALSIGNPNVDSEMVNECEAQIQAYQDSLVAPTITPAPSYSQEQLLLQEQSQLNAVCTNNFGLYSQFNNATNQCSCETGYAIGSDAKCDLITPSCPSGQVWESNSCINLVTPQTYCTDKYGDGAAVGPVVNGYQSCGCANGYAWNQGDTTCVLSSGTNPFTVAPTTPFTNLISITPNASNVEIGSYSFTTTPSHGYQISTVSITIEGMPSGSPAIQNLELTVDGVPFGTTQPTVTNGTYTFSGNPFAFDAGVSATMKVYADVLNPNVNMATELNGCSGIDLTTNAAVTCPTVAGQSIAIVSSQYGQPVASSTMPSAPYIASNLTIGSSGNNVVTLQTFLENKGYLTLPPGVVAGYFGSLTKQAVIAFQTSAGLPATGYCGSMTRAAINAQ